MSIKWGVPLEEATEAVAILQEAAANEGIDFKVLDVGGAIKPLAFATHVLDILPYDNRAWFGHIPGGAGRGAERFSEETWTQHDACVVPWPYEDDYFDVIWCTQTIEDLRDPIVVCKEMVRVGKTGYLQTIDRNFESLRNAEDPNYAGYCHHRWLIEGYGDKLRFTFKFPHIHAIPEFTPPQTGVKYLSLWWTGEFEAFEYIPMSRQEIEDYFTLYRDDLLSKEKKEL